MVAADCWVTALAQDGSPASHPGAERPESKGEREGGGGGGRRRGRRRREGGRKRGKTSKETWRGGNGSGFRKVGRDTSLNWVLAWVTPQGKGEAVSEYLGFSAPSHLPPWLSECSPGEEANNNHLAGNLSVDA